MRTPTFPGCKKATDGRQLVPIGDGMVQTGLYSFDYVGFRCPLKGEYYLSGAVVQAWKAPNDLPFEYHVIKIGEKYSQRTVYAR